VAVHDWTFLLGPNFVLGTNTVLLACLMYLSVWGAVTAVPVFAWELTLAIWLIARGFKPNAILAPPVYLE